MKAKLLSCLLLLFVLPSVSALEFEDDDIMLFGVEAEELLALGSSALAIVLTVLTFLAYKRTENKRLAYVATAFLLFAIRTFLEGSELFMEEIALADPLTALLDFVIMLIFFYSVVKR